MTPRISVRAAGLAVALLLAMVLILAFASVPAAATELTAEQESMAKSIEGELIAPCCWTQTVAEHDSSASEEIKAGIRSLVASGSSKDEIMEFYKDRYGTEILAAPQKSGFDLMAYLFPTLMTLGALGLIVVMLMRWRSREEIVPAVIDDDGVNTSSLRDRLDEELERFDS